MEAIQGPDIKNPEKWEIQQIGANMKDMVYNLIKSSTTEMEAQEKIAKAGFPGVLMEANIKRFLRTHINSLNRHAYKTLDSFKPAYRVSCASQIIFLSLNVVVIKIMFFVIIY